MTRTADEPAVGNASGAAHDPRRHRTDIEGLRFLAVALVVAFHAGVPWLRGGYVGVDVFFVISGFLITGLLVEELGRRGTLSFTGFYARRARRLLPMGLLVLTLTAVAFAAVLSPIDRHALAADIDAAALYAANWHFAGASLVYGTDASVNPVLHYWSLGVEEQFYFVWPAVLYVVTRRRVGHGRPVARTVALALAGIGVASLVASIVLTPRSAPYSYYGLHTRAWEFAVGGLLALGAARLGGLTANVRAVMGWLGMAGIVASAVWFGSSTAFPGYAAMLPVAGTLLVIAAGSGGIAPGPGAADRVLSLRPITYGGRLSYSLYLWHWPCLVMAGTLYADADQPFVAAHGWVSAAAVAVAVALSVIGHHAVENPMRFAPWMQPRRRSLSVGAAGMAVTIGATVLLLPSSTGAIRSPVLAYLAPVSSQAPVTGDPVQRLGHVRLRMTPAEARGDRPSGTAGCYSGYDTTTASMTCVYGDPAGTRSVALVGDSLAEAMFPAVDALARANHWKLWLWTKPACPIVELPVRLPQFQDTYPWCTTWRASVIEQLAGIADLDTVFVTNYSGVLTMPGRFGAPGGGPIAGRDLPAAWAQAWTNTDRALSRTARRVVVLRSTPVQAADVPRCLTQHVPDERPCSTPRSVALRDSERMYDLERGGSTAATRFLDLNDILCPGDPCPVVTSGGDIIYRDDRHLTATVAAQLADALGAKLAALPLPG